MDAKNVRLGFAFTGSFCTLRTVTDTLYKVKEKGYDIFPIMSENVYSTDTRFGKCKDYIEEIESENITLKDNNRNMQDEMIRTRDKLDKVMKNNYSEIKHYKFLRDIKDIIRDREVGYMETWDILETVINKELEKYE